MRITFLPFPYTYVLFDVSLR